MATAIRCHVRPDPRTRSLFDLGSHFDSASVGRIVVASLEPQMVDGAPTARLRCQHCGSRLDVFDTPSGGRTVSVAGLGVSVEHSAKALERFQATTDKLLCPACLTEVDVGAPYRSPRFLMTR